ncbi:MAG: acylhydrolase [Bacteroidales bacterium]|nr:acylhydrolase [Bacteroidales bacterium]
MRSKTAVIALVAFMSICIKAEAQDDWANIGRYEKANSELTVQPKAVFMGDSITQCWYDADPGFFNDNNFACRGISGQTTSHMLVCMRKDVVNLKPKYVVILAGTNDIAKNNGFIEVDDIYGNIVSMCEIAKANKIKPVICSVLPVKQYRWRTEVTDCADRIIRLNAMLKDYADKNRIRYVDYHSVMKDAENGLPKKWSYDGVHLNGDGYDIIEGIILKELK